MYGNTETSYKHPKMLREKIVLFFLKKNMFEANYMWNVELGCKHMCDRMLMWDFRKLNTSTT